MVAPPPTCTPIGVLPPEMGLVEKPFRVMLPPPDRIWAFWPMFTASDVALAFRAKPMPLVTAAAATTLPPPPPIRMLPPLDLICTLSATATPPNAVPPLAALRVTPSLLAVEVMLALTKMFWSARKVRVASPPAVLAMALLTVMSPLPEDPAPGPVLTAVDTVTLVPLLSEPTMVPAAVESMV